MAYEVVMTLFIVHLNVHRGCEVGSASLLNQPSSGWVAEWRIELL